MVTKPAAKGKAKVNPFAKVDKSKKDDAMKGKGKGKKC
jgi:hypothetical protein